MSMFALGAAAVGSMLAQQGAQSSGSVLNSWATNSARESLNKNITKTNLKIQKEYDKWTQAQDMAYNKEWEQWYQNYLYGIQNKEYFDLSKKYATNTASWAVQGLRKAGLNPILAAIDGNLSSNMGNAGPQSSPSGRHSKGSIPSGSVPSAVASSPFRLSAMQDLINSAKQGELMDAQKSNIEQQTTNLKANEGLSGSFGALFNALNKVGLKDDMQSLAKEGVKWLKRKLGIDASQSTAKNVPPESIGISDADLDKHLGKQPTEDEVRSSARKRLELEKDRLRDMPFKGKMSPIWTR